MKMKIALAFAGLILLAAGAGAQTKIAGTIQCAKPVELAGVQAKTGEDTAFSEADGTKSRDSGYDVTTMANSDQFTVRFSGNSVTDKNGMVQTQSGTWSFVRGTGKLKGITGKGTFTGKGATDGTVTTDVAGEYQIGAN